MNVRKSFILLSIVIPILIFALSLISSSILWSFVLILPLIVLGYYDMSQKKQTIKRNFPVIGNLRYLLEAIRPEIMQYFVETDTEGRPINRINRSLIYQRAKNVPDSTPFGTQMNVYDIGYEWMTHSVYAKNPSELVGLDTVVIGGKDCKQPYTSSVLNISGMSFGSLSKNAVLALNKGAKRGGFAQSTGEGGVSPYHLEHGGDLIWQIGTGYFGCRSKEGGFSQEVYLETVSAPSIKMVEIKLSQGAKPGHGGILPASKNTLEIAKIRNVEPHTAVLSPPFHTAFRNPTEMMKVKSMSLWIYVKP
jgi:glutamate synthase domain-containing protein 2